MVEFVLGIFFIMLGGIFIHSALKLKRTQDIGLIENKMVNIDKIKDKDSYVKFNFKINITLGGIFIIQGLIYIIATYCSIIDNISWFTDMILMLTMLICFYLLICKAPKF